MAHPDHSGEMQRTAEMKIGTFPILMEHGFKILGNKVCLQVRAQFKVDHYWQSQCVGDVSCFYNILTISSSHFTS